MGEGRGGDAVTLSVDGWNASAHPADRQLGQGGKGVTGRTVTKRDRLLSPASVLPPGRRSPLELVSWAPVFLPHNIEVNLTHIDPQVSAPK